MKHAHQAPPIPSGPASGGAGSRERSSATVTVSTPGGLQAVAHVKLDGFLPSAPGGLVRLGHRRPTARPTARHHRARPSPGLFGQPRSRLRRPRPGPRPLRGGRDRPRRRSFSLTSEGEGADVVNCGPEHLAVQVATAVCGHDRLAITVRSRDPGPARARVLGRPGGGRRGRRRGGRPVQGGRRLRGPPRERRRVAPRRARLGRRARLRPGAAQLPPRPGARVRRPRPRQASSPPPRRGGRFRAR